MGGSKRRTRGAWCVVLTVLGVLLGGTGLGAQTRRGPQRGGNTAHDLGCITCHSTHKPKGPTLFPNDTRPTTAKGTPLFGSEGMCYSCHRTEERGGRFFEPGLSHPVNVPVPPGMVVPRELGTTLVRGVGEVITCTSCHDPHNREPDFLKRPLEGDRLCVSCHQDMK